MDFLLPIRGSHMGLKISGITATSAFLIHSAAHGKTPRAFISSSALVTPGLSAEIIEDQSNLLRTTCWGAMH